MGQLNFVSIKKQSFKKVKIEFMKIQNEHLEEQRRLNKESHEKQNERLEKMFKLFALKNG